MKTGGSITLLFVGLALVFNAVPGCAQVRSASTTAPEYKAGQVWKYKTAASVDDSVLIILKVETGGKKDNLVHIRIDGMPLPSCGGFHLTTSIEHLAVTEKALRKTTTQLLKESVALPDNYFIAYNEWRSNRHREVIQRPLSEVVLPAPPGMLICNWRETT
jgi:hypothetical protein